MTPIDISARARGATALSVGYKLGAGGRDPASPTPADDLGYCDCSGFVAWTLGIPRKVPTARGYSAFNGGWFSTDGMVHDLIAAREILTPPPFDMDTRPGMVLVYGNGDRVGHCGIVASVSASPGRAVAGVVLTVIDCSSRGIRERSYDAFAKRAATPVYLAVYTGWVP